VGHLGQCHGPGDPSAPDIFSKVLANYSDWATLTRAVDAVLPSDVVGEKREKYIELLAPNDVSNLPKLIEALIANLTQTDRLDKFRIELFKASAAKPILREF
jgi:hypothetical protein